MSLFILITTAVSCSKEDDPGLDDSVGTFDLTISGDEDFKFSGEAFFEELIINGGTPQDRGTTLSIIFADDFGTSVAISMIQAEITGFDEGTYSFIEEPASNQVFLAVSLYSAETGTTYLISSGSVKFDRVNEKLIEGSLNVQLQNLSGGNVRVSGSFKARDLLFF